jgi:hypothetical protein
MKEQLKSTLVKEKKGKNKRKVLWEKQLQLLHQALVQPCNSFIFFEMAFKPEQPFLIAENILSL